MKLKALIARWRSARILKQARKHRRILRDRQRRFLAEMMGEFEVVYDAEKRSRGLRIFAAWALQQQPALVPVRAYAIEHRLREVA